MKTLGLYIHIPFCRSKCLYCDFCSFPHPKQETVDQYVERLCRDLVTWSARASGYAVDTVYFGGGTPTLLRAEQIIRVLETVTAHFALSSDAEITVECNPKTGDGEYFAKLRRAGFNRISIGLQSVHDEELKRLGRGHRFADFCRTYEDVRRAGFANVSADVMSGIPCQTVESYLQTLEKLCELSPEHISAYGLIVEDGTPFATLQSRGQLGLPDEEEAREMYFTGANFLAFRGYAQYEISNFAKPGYESRHNVKYWNCDEFLGVGVAAYSDFLGERFGNLHDIGAYIEGRDISCDRERPTEAERQNEYVMLRMRLSEGVSAAAFKERFGADFDQTFGKRLEKYETGGFVIRRADGYAFSREGMYVSNAILSDVLEF